MLLLQKRLKLLLHLNNLLTLKLKPEILFNINILMK